MDQNQRQQVAAQVASAREARAWSQEVLATEAGVAPNTVGSIEAGKNVRPGSLGKVFRALDIEPLVESMRREDMPADVHLVTEVVSLWLARVPESERPTAVLDLFSFLASPHGDGGEK